MSLSGAPPFGSWGLRHLHQGPCEDGSRLSLASSRSQISAKLQGNLAVRPGVGLGKPGWICEGRGCFQKTLSLPLVHPGQFPQEACQTHVEYHGSFVSWSLNSKATSVVLPRPVPTLFERAGRGPYAARCCPLQAVEGGTARSTEWWLFIT